MKTLLAFSTLIAGSVQDFDSTYTDEERGFSIPVPKGWSITRSADRGKYLVLRAPAEQRTGAILLLAIFDPMKAITEGTITVDTYIDEVKKNYPKRFTEFEFVKAEKGKDGENPTLTLHYRYVNGGQKIGQLQYLVWTKTQHWSLSWGCLDEAFEKNRELFERCSKAFKPAPKK